MQKLTREQIREIYDLGTDAVIALVEKLFSTIEALSKQVTILQERVDSLEKQIAKDSHNSDKPPSSDGPKKKAVLPGRLGKRKAGGQKGHEGHTLKRVADPDKTEICSVATCKQCGQSLNDAPIADYESRQVFDLPPGNIEVTEYQAEIKACPDCDTFNKAAFPKGVTQPVQYGSRIKSQLVYLMNQHLLPYERTCEIISDLYGHIISPGTLFNANQACFDALEGAVQEIKAQLTTSETVHFDESGFRVEGKGQWLHSVSTEDLTYYHFHQKRGSEAMDEIDILPGFQGVAVHDHWKPYFKYDCRHALCNAHHLRELIFIIERYGQDWAQEMIDLLLDIKNAVDLAKTNGKKHLDKNILAGFEHRYRQILADGFRVNPDYDPRRKKKKRTDPQKLLHRLLAFETETLAFMYDFSVPFDNNLAERDIRMVKLQQKISGCFRKQKGAEIFCRIRSYISTARKQGCDIIEALQRAMSNQPMIPVAMAE